MKKLRQEVILQKIRDKEIVMVGSTLTDGKYNYHINREGDWEYEQRNKSL